MGVTHLRQVAALNQTVIIVTPVTLAVRVAPAATVVMQIMRDAQGLPEQRFDAI